MSEIFSFSDEFCKEYYKVMEEKNSYGQFDRRTKYQ